MEGLPGRTCLALQALPWVQPPPMQVQVPWRRSGLQRRVDCKKEKPGPTGMNMPDPTLFVLNDSSCLCMCSAG
jgi:hypothetical protein